MKNNNELKSQKDDTKSENTSNENELSDKIQDTKIENNDSESENKNDNQNYNQIENKEEKSELEDQKDDANIENKEDAQSPIENDIYKPDDIYKLWSTPYIEKFFDYEILKEEFGSSFNPKNVITRGEFAKIVYNYLEKFDKLDKNNRATIQDIDDSPYKDEIEVLVGNKILIGYEKSGFKPQNEMKRDEIARILANIINAEVPELPPVEIKYTVLNVPYVSQLYPVYAPIGCEPTSVYAALKYKGYVNNVSHRQFLNNMPYDYINPNRGFVGHYSGFRNYNKRETIFPNALSKYAAKYGNVVDFSGKSLEDIKKQICLGNPVVVYVTLYWREPYFRNYYVEGQTYRRLRNNHVVVLCGYNPKNDSYYVSDCYNINNTRKPYKYWVKGKTLNYIYNFRKHAILVK